ncbi:hypothetical protein ACFUAC_06790 [Streptomyces sp. NPDC057148]|uniref:hypothetical protein n=1 Tax=unclassified Streptomyces TaxID=2593676 RepID=UPI00362748BC
MKSAHFTHFQIAPILAALGAGALLGAIGPFASKFDNLVCQVVGNVFSVGWSWACFAFLVGYSRRSRIEASLLASSSLAVGVAVYYLFKFLSPDVPTGGIVISGAGDGLFSRALLWGTAAFVFGAPVGLLGSMARTPGIGGLGFRMIIPLIAFFEASQRQAAGVDDSQGGVVEMVWASIRALSVVAVVLLVGHTAWSWWHGRRTRQPAPAKRL